MRTRIGRAGASVAALYFVVFGAWALLLPRSFFDRIATWPPFNEHLIHDAGALQLGIGVGLAAALLRNWSRLAPLIGAAVATLLHVVSHVVDYGEGGRSSDPYALGAVAVIVCVAVFAEIRSGDDG
jgi:hypothetical protein